MHHTRAAFQGLAIIALATTCLAGSSDPARAAAGDGRVEGSQGRDPVDRGKTIYERRCAVCHGPQGKGDGPEAPFLSPRPASLLSAATSVKSDTELLRIIENGKPRTAMPGWRDALTETERSEVLAYLRSLIRFQHSPNPAPPAQ